MKFFLIFLCSLSVCAMLASCTSSLESKADEAYNKARTAQGGQKELLLKKAYMGYNAAIKQNPSAASTKLKERFIEMSLLRMKKMVDEGSHARNDVKLFIRDIDNTMFKEMSADLKNQYANILAQIADSFFVNENMDSALSYINKAAAIATDPQEITTKRELMVKGFADSHYELAKRNYEEALKLKEQDATQAFVTAEYYTLLTLLYFPDYPGAQELLSKIRQKNKGTYSAYKSVLDFEPNPQVNKYDIFLAVTSEGPNSMKVNMFNYSYNPLRLKAEHFFAVDENDNKTKALPSSSFKKEILDQDHELLDINLVFPSKGKTKKLIYENGDHYTEKVFY